MSTSPRQPLLRPQAGFLIALLVLAVAVRLLPYVLAHFGMNITPDETNYPWGFSAFPAICLFGGACFADRRWAFAIPFAVLIVSDVGIGALSGNLHWMIYPSQLIVYASYAMIVGVGFVLRPGRPFWAVGAAGLGASVLFYLTTNFGVWVCGDGTLYPKTPAGLWQCYVNALPFFRNFVIGMAVFLPILFSPLAVSERESADWDGDEALVPVRNA
ncbi:MAG TPA: DUF6580 family putative transport protein [Planctomycetaceae bacterium]|nr:DUF6580 family putative transport protein [Planctomycetaceae bacterium]